MFCNDFTCFSSFVVTPCSEFTSSGFFGSSFLTILMALNIFLESFLLSSMSARSSSIFMAFSFSSRLCI